jgi:GAF domain
VRREARISGLGDAHPPTLKAVDRRRLELWSVAAFVVMALAVAAVLPSLWPALPEPISWLTPSRARTMVLVLMAGLVAYVIEKLVALNRLRKLLTQERENVADLSSRVDQLSGLLAVGKAMNSELALRDVLGIILESAVELLQATGGAILLVDGPAHLTAVCTLSNDAARGVRVLIGQGLAGRVALTREPLVINGPFDPGVFALSAEPHLRESSAMLAPLVNRGEVLGVLNVFSGSREFSADDLRPMTLFAEHAALSIVNSRLYETERRRVAELRELNRSG